MYRRYIQTNDKGVDEQLLVLFLWRKERKSSIIIKKEMLKMLHKNDENRVNQVQMVSISSKESSFKENRRNNRFFLYL